MNLRIRGDISPFYVLQDLLQDFEGECYDKLGQKDYERFSNPK